MTDKEEMIVEETVEEVVNETQQPSTGSMIVSALDKFFSVVKKYKIADYLRAFGVVMLCLVCYFAYKAASNEELMSALVKKVEYNTKLEHNKLIARQQVTPKINYELENMMLRLGADRTFVIELHNGKENATYLPFLYYDMTYEEVNRKNKIERIAHNFQNVNISNFKLPYYLEEHFMFIGSYDDIYKIDPFFADNFIKFGGKHGAFIFLKSSGKEIGFLGVAFNSDTNVDYSEIKESLIEYGQIISPLLDLDKQITLENTE